MSGASSDCLKRCPAALAERDWAHPTRSHRAPARCRQRLYLGACPLARPRDRLLARQTALAHKRHATVDRAAVPPLGRSHPRPSCLGVVAEHPLGAGDDRLRQELAKSRPSPRPAGRRNPNTSRFSGNNQRPAVHVSYRRTPEHPVHQPAPCRSPCNHQRRQARDAATEGRSLDLACSRKSRSAALSLGVATRPSGCDATSSWDQAGATSIPAVRPGLEGAY